MLQAPFDKVIVKLKSHYSDEIQFQSGVKLYIDPSYNPNFHATSDGIVHSVPVGLRGSNSKIIPIIRPGDEVLFSYKTVGDITFQDNTELFRMTTKGEGFFTTWMNQERFTLHMEKTLKDRQWAVVYTDRFGEWIAGKVGTQGECENWMTRNFKFATGEGFTYDNKFYNSEEELWRVDYSYVFAIRRDGHMKMVGDYLLVEPIVENLPELIQSSRFIRPEMDRMIVREDKGWLRCGGRGSDGMRNGDVIYFDPNMKEKYNIQGKPWYVVKKQYVTGKETSAVGFDSIGIN